MANGKTNVHGKEIKKIPPVMERVDQLIAAEGFAVMVVNVLDETCEIETYGEYQDAKVRYERELGEYDGDRNEVFLLTRMKYEIVESFIPD